MEPRLLALLALASVAIAGPITVQETNNCATECPTSTKFNYAPGTTYMYDYRVDYSTSMSGASEDSAKLTLTATAELEVLGPCEMALSLRNTRLFHSDARGGLKAADGEELFRSSLEASPLRFSYQNGVVENICTGNRDEAWVMNVKKGVLSAFQNSMGDLTEAQNVTETDVAGTCETQYQAVSNGYYSTSVKKVKDMLTCTGRHDYRTMLQMVPYNVPSELQNIPLMKTTHECDQVIQKGGVLESTTCTEMHVYMPFSNGQSGGATSVKQALTYKTYKRGTSSRQDSISSRDSLVYDHSASRPNGEQARDLVEQKLKEICDSTSYDVRPESPRLFSELVSALRVLEKQTMEEIIFQLKTKSLCPTNNKAYKTFLDALPMIGSDSSVSLMTKLITEDDVKGLEAKAWIASLAFIREPTSEMLLEAKPLIDNEKVRETALLPVSSMVNNFCSRSSSCDQSYAVLSIMASLERSIGSGCDASGKDFHQILLTLRAIGNAGHAKRAVSVILKCLSNSNNPLEIRVAAAGAFRRMPCDDESAELWNTYENADLDSELRIAAYQALLRCPTDVTLSKMAASLDGDLDEQVGAYVYSHLTNLKETSDPHKQGVAQAMDNLVIPNKFESSVLKASSNLEASALINKINTGFVAESNLVWSNNAQLPRSASANLTVELFGQSINLVDFGGRLEGLENIMKNIFGPGSDEGKKSKTSDDYHGSIYGRMFGNEMLFLHSEQINSPFDKISSKWLDMLITLSKKQEFTYTHSAQFMDASVTIPTVAGLPIHIDVNGSAVVDLVLNGKADLRGLGAAPRSVDIDGEIRPSAAMEITGAMSVDAHVTKTGLRMRNTLHTSTSLQGRIQMQRGEVLNVELDSPMEKMEIFDASSKFFILHNNVEQEQKMITENRKEFELCSCDRMSEITGVVLCGQVSFPNASMQSEGPYFPLTGPSSASLVLRKTDTHSGYKLLAKRIRSKTSSVAQISFNTPGSRVNRVILIDMSLDYPGQSVEAQVVSPWKTAAFTGSMVGKSDLKSLSGRLTVDNSDVYALTSQVKISQSKRKIQLNPMVEIRRPGADDIQLSGFIGMEGPWKSLDVDLSLSGLQKLPYNVKTSLFSGKKETSLTASISDDGDKTNYGIEAKSYLHFVNKRNTVLAVKNSLKMNTPKRTIVDVETSAEFKGGKSFKLDGSVDIHKFTKIPATINVDVSQTSKKRGLRYEIDANVKSEMMTGRVVSNNLVKKSGTMSTKTSLDYTIPKVAKNRIILNGKFNDRSTKAYTKYNLKGNVLVKKNPEYNMGIDFGFDHKKKHSGAELEIKYGPNHKDATKRVYLNAVLDGKKIEQKEANVNYKLKALAPEYNVDVVLTGNHEHEPTKVTSDVQLSYGKNKDVKAAITLRDRSEQLTKLNGHATVSWPGTEYKLSSKLDQKSEKHFIHDITLKRNDGLKHSIDSEYKMPESDSHIFSTVFDLDGHKKLTVSGSTNLDGRTPHASGEIKYGKDKYGLSTKAKMSKGLGGSVVVEMVHPERRVLMKVEGEKDKNKYDGSIEASWDADNDKSKMITMKGNTFNKRSKNSVSVGGEMSLTSPFENFENLASSFKYGSDRAQHDITGKVSWGEKNKQFMSSATLQKPISLSHFVATVEAKTPFRRMRSASADISHTWGDALNTILKGNLNKESAKLVIQGEGSLKNLRGNAVLSSTIKNAEDVSASLTHTCDSGVSANSIVLNHNGDAYGYTWNMDHNRNGWQIQNSGDLVITSPKSQISTSWQHKNSDNDINSKLSSKWGNKRLNVHLSGSHELSHLRNINGEFKINSPWKSLGEVIVSLNHKHGDGFLNSKAQLTQDGTQLALSDVKFSKTTEAADMDFILKSPFHEDLSGKLNAKCGSYPLTSEIEFEWAPRKKITAETILNAENWEDAVFDFKLATPIRHYRKINLRASNKKEGEEMVSHANLDYGVRKTIDLETRHALTAQNKMARLRLTTPFESVRSLDTGLRFDGHAADFESSADFEMIPVVEKYQGSAKWRYDGDLTSNLRLDTPHPEYPYFELSTSSKDNGKLRKSRVEARLHPRQVYALDAAYSFDLPISVEATISSPYPEYDNLGLVFQHNHSPSRVDSHGELRYQADKKIEGDLNADWTSDIEGSLTVKTPFSGYESNKLAVRHHGDIDDFSSHGEINVAEKSVVADASFKSGHTTTGTFTLSSPITGMENIEVSLKKKGRARNFKGEAVLIVNNDKTEVDYHHRLTKDGLKSSFKLVTPYIENIKLSFEHNGVPEQFTNEISANYGRKYLVDTTVTFGYNHPDVTGYGTIVYKLGGRKQKGSINFNKNGALEDMSFRGNAGFNDDEVSVSGSWKNINGLQGDLQINTPFKGFKNTGMTLSHEGKLNNFRSSARVTYMDKKTIDGNIDVKVKGLKRISLESEINTPFKLFPSARVTFNHKYDKQQKTINGDASLTTPVAEFGSGSLTYEKTGSIKDFEAVTSATRNGRQVAGLRLRHTMSDQEAHSSVSLEAAEYSDLTLTFDHMGGLDDFNTKASGTLGNDRVEGEISKSGPLDDLTMRVSGAYNREAVDVSATWNSRRGINGNLEIKTPFENFNNIGMSVSHNGDMSDFVSSANVEYMDDKTISGQIELSNTDNFRLTSELSTPFQGFENTRVEVGGVLDKYSEDVSATASLTTTINDFGTGDVSFSKSGSLDNLVVDGSILRNNVELVNARITNRLAEKELHSTFTSRGSAVPELSATLDHSGDLSNFETSADARLDNRNIFESKVTFDKTDSTVNADAMVRYDIDSVGSNFGSLRIEKEGPMDDIQMKIIANYNDDKFTVDGKMKLKDELTGSLTVNTPVEGYNDIGMSFSHSGNLEKFNTEGQINIVDGEKYSGKIDFYRSEFNTVEALVEIRTPIQDAEFTKFEYRHDGQKEKFTCFSSLEYGQSDRITCDLSAVTTPNLGFTVSIKTPFDNYEDMMASATVETSWPKLSIDSTVNAGAGRRFTLRGALDASKGISGEVALSTPVDGFTDVGLSFTHSGKIKHFTSEGRITYMDDKQISGKVSYKHRRQHFIAELKTPFKGYKHTKYEWRQSQTDADLTSTTYFKYGNGKVVSTEMIVTFKPKPGFDITIKTPTEQYEELKASASFDNSWPKFEFNGKASSGIDRQVTLDITFDATNDISGLIDIKTPFDGFNNVGMNFLHSGNAEKFDTEGKITYMDEQDITGKVSFYKYMDRRLSATAELNTPFEGAKFTKAELNYEGYSNSLSTTAALEYGDRQKMDGNMKLTYSPNYEALITINTPFRGYKVISAQGSVDVTAPSYSAGYRVNYGYDTVYSANGKLNTQSINDVEGSLEVVLPIQGIEFTKAEYQHKMDSSRLDGSVSMTYGDSKTISGELRASNNPNYDITITVNTPFVGYETMQGSATYDVGYNKYDLSSSVSLGRDQTFSITSGLDMSDEPSRASVQINTPYNVYRNMELVLTHEGTLENFRCTGFLASPLTDNINAETSVRYNTPSDMEASASIKSSFEGMDDLMAEIKNSDVAGEKKTHAAVGWTRGQQVVFDGLVRQQESWYENKVYGEMSLSSPFVAVQNLAVQMEHSGKQEEATQTLSVELNGDRLLDVDTEYSSKSKHQASVTFKKPLAMKYSVAASSDAGVHEAEVLANWNRDETDSNVRLLASVRDQSDSYKTEHSVDIGVEHASRKMGIVHTLSSSDPLTSSFGKFYWDSDDSSKVFYDMQIKDNSRRRKEVKEGYINLGLPSRTLGLSGSYSDNQVVKSGDATFSWDTDRNNKQVGIKGTITRGDRITGDVTLSMPAIKKEIHLTSEVTVQSGRVILDTKTDISYSPDSRKTLTLTSKLEDISDYYSRYNYSLKLGVSHPYTNVDIQMTSHLGSSDEKMTVGVNTDYLTARRENKNLGLLAEINKLKKQISLQITNPDNKVEIIGDVVSTRPYTVRMLNKLDDVEMFRSDFTLDEDKKSVEFNMFEGSEGLRLWAGYPNNTAFRSEVSRISYGSEMTEALLAVRLNTSRLMHTRLHWNPDMLQRFEQAIEGRARADGVKALEAIVDLHSAVSDEIAGKYSDITSSIREELAPLVDDLDKELTQMANAIVRLSRAMKKEEMFVETQEQLSTFARQFRKSSKKIIQSLNNGLDAMVNYPIKENYEKMVADGVSSLKDSIIETLSILESYLSMTEEALVEYRNKMAGASQDVADSVYNATYMTYLSDQLNSIDYSSYVPSIEIPEDYTNVIYTAHGIISNNIGAILDAPGIRRVKGGLNEVYQQGVWAYNYWELEQNIQSHAKNILTLIREIVEAELKEYAHELQEVYPITVWDPEHGEVQADFKLPLDVARLDQVPDISPLTNQVVAYLPDASTLDKVAEYVPDVWSSTPEEQDDVKEQLSKYKPTRRVRKHRGRKWSRQ